MINAFRCGMLAAVLTSVALPTWAESLPEVTMQAVAGSIGTWEGAGAVIARCAELGGRTLSVHSRRAVRGVLSEFERHPNFGTAVMHWFSGSTSELKDAAAHGCWFSIGPAMFESANGRALAEAMPQDRVVPESDGPFAKVGGKSILPWNTSQTAEGLAPLWATSPDEAAEMLARNGQTLLYLMGQR